MVFACGNEEQGKGRKKNLSAERKKRRAGWLRFHYALWLFITKRGRVSLFPVIEKWERRRRNW